MKTGQTYCYLKWSLWTLMTVFVIGCQTEDIDVNNVLPAEGIAFGAAVYEGSAVKTRALQLNDITSDPYNIDFFIQLDCAKDNTSEIKRYRVADSYAGRLDAKDSDKRLNWKDATSGHTFYAWTLPWLENAEGYESLDDYYDKDKKQQRIEVVFHDSGEGENYDKYHNNAILEKFIGAQIGPYNYREQGTYVPLTFYHLVSQIRLGKLTVIRSDGSRHEDLKANLTFIGMPKKAVFDPHPYTYIENPHPAEWIKYPDNWNKQNDWNIRLHHPVVIGPKEGYEEDSEVTFFIPESAPDGRPSDRFYVCPEIDFSKLVFKVMITTENVPETNVEYYGNFSNVQFKRINKTDYDKGKGTDDTVLHAGEMMTLNITLYPGVGPGASITIQDWNDTQPTEALQHSHKGIYTDGEAQRLVDVFGSNNPTEDEVKNLYDLYGEDRENGEKVFNLYENVTVSGSKFPIGEGYVLDGLGHTITMGSTNDIVTIGNMRDVYITDGTNTIYIDSEGNVCLYNPETYSYDNIKGNLNNDKSNYTINLRTGVVS